MVDWQTYVWVPSASESVSHTNSENKNHDQGLACWQAGVGGMSQGQQK